MNWSEFYWNEAHKSLTYKGMITKFAWNSIFIQGIFELKEFKKVYEHSKFIEFYNTSLNIRVYFNKE